MLVTKLAMNSAMQLLTCERRGVVDAAVSVTPVPKATYALQKDRQMSRPAACLYARKPPVPFVIARLQIRQVRRPRVRVLPRDEERVDNRRDRVHPADEVAAVAVLPRDLGEVGRARGRVGQLLSLRGKGGLL